MVRIESFAGKPAIERHDLEPSVHRERTHLIGREQVHVVGSIEARGTGPAVVLR
jgi:hypothetical protein